MDSGNNSSSLQSSSGGGGGAADDDFDSTTFFPATTTTTNTTTTNHHLPNFFDSLPFFDPTSPFPLLPVPPPQPSSPSPRAPPAPAPPPPAPTRNPKKRTRASRRAPTTVLTTDTSNFRAMVQEFTGIPAPPFSAAAAANPLTSFGHLSNTRPRFDFFNASSIISSSSSTSPSNFLLKPYPQKLQFPGPPPPPAPPVLNFQSLLQTQLQQAATASAQQLMQQQESARMVGPADGGNDQYGSGELGNVIGSGWMQDAGAGADAGRMMRQAQAPDGSSRGEGMVESWICSSD